jgi:ATP-binding cassette subfamily B protein
LDGDAAVWSALTARKEWKFFAVLPKAAPGLAATWWTVLLLRGMLPAAFAIAMGVLVAAVQHQRALVGPLALAGAIFVLLQVLSPVHQVVGANLGDRTAAWLYDRLTEACVRPPGIGHLEDPALTADLTVARDFDLGMTGPPLAISMDFIATGVVEMIGGIASAAILLRYAWWAPLLLVGAWLATHWLLRESGVWHDRNTEEVRAAQRDVDYAKGASTQNSTASRPQPIVDGRPVETLAIPNQSPKPNSQTKSPNQSPGAPPSRCLRRVGSAALPV